MNDQLNPYPGNLKHHKVEPKENFSKEEVQKILKEIQEIITSRLDENAPGPAIHARIQDLQHISQIIKKYNLK